MNPIEQGIELTIKVLMKVKDDEIAALCDAINDRDIALEKLRQENELLKAENKEVKRQRDIRTIVSQSTYDHMKNEIDDLRQIHQAEMKRKCQKALFRMRKQNETLSKDERLKMFCEQNFNFNRLAVKNHRNAEKLKSDLRMKVKEMSEYQAAVLDVAKDGFVAHDKMDIFKNRLENKNIDILTNILDRYGCRTALAVIKDFPTFMDEDGKPRTYDDAGMDTDHDGTVESLYHFDLRVCEECDHETKETCFYTRELDYSTILGSKSRQII